MTLDPAYKVPADVKDAKLWEESIGYGNKGYFGWNSLSKNLALFYVTGNKKYASEFLRLAFPKDKATEQELFKRDGEAYKDDFSVLQIAYLTQDDTFIRFYESLPVDKTCFRLGQSFLPAEPYGRNSLREVCGKWDVFRGELQSPAPPFEKKYVVNVMSYRDTADSSGDYLMMDTSCAPDVREVTRTFALFNVRIDGTPVLRGHTNTLRFYADGGSEGGQRYYTKVLEHGTAGPCVYHTAMVPDDNGFDWKRTTILRKRSWLLIADEVTPKRDMASGELYNDFTTLFAGFTDGTIRRIAPDGSIDLLGRMPGTVKTVLVTGGRIFAGDNRGCLAVFRY